MSEDEAKSYIGNDATSMTPLSECPNSSAILARLGQLGSSLSVEIRDIVSKEAQQLVQVQIADPANDESAKVSRSAHEARNQSKVLTLSDVCLATGVSAERIQAQLKYAVAMKRINEDIIAADDIAIEIRKTDGEIRTVSTTNLTVVVLKLML